MKKNHSFFHLIFTLIGLAVLNEYKITVFVVLPVLAQTNQQECSIPEKNSDNLSENLAEKKEIADSFFDKGIERFKRENLGNSQISLECLENALMIYKDIENEGDLSLSTQLRNNVDTREEQSKTYQALGDVHRFLAQSDPSSYNLALNNYKEASKIMVDLQIRQEQSITKQKIGKIYYELGQYEEAEEIQQEALGIVERIDDKDEEILEGKILLDLANSHIGRRKFKEAIKRNQKALSIMTRNNEEYYIVQAHHQLGKSLSQIGQYDEAEGELEKAIAKIKSIRLRTKDMDGNLAQNQLEIATSLQLVLFSKNIRNITKQDLWRDQII